MTDMTDIMGLSMMAEMSDQERVPMGDLLKGWDEALPLMTLDSMVRQLLLAVQDGEVARLAQDEKISKLTQSLAETRARLRFLEDGGEDDVYL